MAKNLVICCDGTWNTPDQADNGVPIPTNVVRLFNCVAAIDAKTGIGQHTYYHPGVGTGGAWWDKVLGGGAGLGLDHNIMSAYREICDHYGDGDQLFLFGFSRGAYTVRSLAGLLHACGILDTRGLSESDTWARIQQLFSDGYRHRPKDQPTWHHDGWAMRVEPGQARIHFIGVWDTVGALGIPDDMALLSLLDDLYDHTFYDTSLNPSVVQARHAVAMDERRASFLPTLWDDADPRVVQLWFPGVHSDVGGGYLETGLSDGALRWMIEQADAAGLSFDAAMVGQIRPDAQGVLHDSVQGVFSVLPTQPRNLPDLAGSPRLHPSACDRHAHPPITQAPYHFCRPLDAAQPSASLEVYATQPWNETGLWLEAGVSYRFTAEGEWLDAKIPCGPDGMKDGKFHLGEIAHALGSTLGAAEQWFRRLSHNPEAEFRGTKRFDAYPWFCLMGIIANGAGVDPQGRAIAHEVFKIGSAVTHTPAKSGYLYACANDAWGFYGNNRGRLRLTVARL